MKTGADIPMTGYFWIIAAILLIALGGWATASYFEAQAFNHATGKSVTTWDAMWIELRVQESAK